MGCFLDTKGRSLNVNHKSPEHEIFQELEDIRYVARRLNADIPGSLIAKDTQRFLELTEEAIILAKRLGEYWETWGWAKENGGAATDHPAVIAEARKYAAIGALYTPWRQVESRISMSLYSRCLALSEEDSVAPSSVLLQRNDAGLYPQKWTFVRDYKDAEIKETTDFIDLQEAKDYADNYLIAYYSAYLLNTKDKHV